MPIPQAIAVFNKYMTNKFFKLFAGRLPPLAVITHRGRHTGKTYSNPVMAFKTGRGFTFALTYGEKVDWVKNLQASGYGELRYGGEVYSLNGFKLLNIEDVEDVFPSAVRMTLGLIGVKHCLDAEAKRIHEE
jgi:deazaflavin-dependent oxidoreductase (nitroreductase family)